MRPSATTTLMFAALLAVAVVGCSSDRGSDGAPLPEVTPETEVFPGESYVLRVGTHCGVERLGLPVNDVFWITDEADAGTADWLPAEWTESVEDGLIPLTVVLSADRSELTVEAAGRAVAYGPVLDTDPEALCV